MKRHNLSESVLSIAVVAVALQLFCVTGCSNSAGSLANDEVADGFTAGSGDSFGTLKDETGTFEIGTEDGEIATVEVQQSDGSKATLSLPTLDDNTFAVETEDGGLAISQADNGGILISLSDPLVGDQVFEVNADIIPFFDIQAIRAASQNSQACAISRELLDATCEAVNLLDLDTAVEAILAELEKFNFPITITAEAVRALLDKYLDPLLSFCSSWEDFRVDGDPCGI